eukprot:352738-Chlamydomonas_euryale.AAC.8
MGQKGEQNILIVGTLRSYAGHDTHGQGVVVENALPSQLWLCSMLKLVCMASAYQFLGSFKGNCSQMWTSAAL